MNPIIVVMIGVLAIVPALTACGSGGASDVLGTGATDSQQDNQSPYSSTNVQVTPGVYSFITTTPSYSCSNGNSGIATSGGGAVQMQVKFTNGWMTTVQTAASSETTTETVSSTGMRVISSSLPGGPLSSQGDFILTSSALLDDPKVGYMRVSYRTEGKFSARSWTGKHAWTVIFEDLNLTCTYSSTFSGYLQY